MHRQLRALTILDGLIQNAGSRFQRTFADEPLLERLRVLAKDDMVDPDVKAKCNLLFRQWATAYKGQPGLDNIAVLYKQFPQLKRPQPSQSKVVRETEQNLDRDDPMSPTSPTHQRKSSRAGQSTSSSQPSLNLNPTAVIPSHPVYKKDKKGKNKPFNLEKERAQLMETIAFASMACTNLMNALQLVNREEQRVSENSEALSAFEVCKRLRRQILRYIQLVESDQFIGSLLSANDELVKALMAFEIYDKSIDDDSDSDTPPGEHFARSPVAPTPEERIAAMSLEDSGPAKPPRPSNIAIPSAGKQKQEDSEPEEEYDEDNPFGDQNAVKTPYVEKSGMTW